MRIVDGELFCCCETVYGEDISRHVILREWFVVNGVSRRWKEGGGSGRGGEGGGRRGGGLVIKNEHAIAWY